MEQKEIDDIMDYNTRFVKFFLNRQGELSPMVVICKDDEISVGMLMGDGDMREAIRKFMLGLSKSNIDWVTFIVEGYSKQYAKEDNPDELEHGILAKNFGKDKSIRENVMISFYSKTHKVMRIIDKKTGKHYDTIDFEGYLSIPDVDRVMNWNDI